MYNLQEYTTNDPSPPARPHLPIACSALNSWMNQSTHEISTLVLRSPLGSCLHQWRSKPIGQAFVRKLHMWTVTEFFPDLSCWPPKVSAWVLVLFPVSSLYGCCCRGGYLQSIQSPSSTDAAAGLGTSTLSNFLPLEMVLQEWVAPLFLVSSLYRLYCRGGYLHGICLPCLFSPAPELKMLLLEDFPPCYLFLYLWYLEWEWHKSDSVNIC